MILGNSFVAEPKYENNRQKMVEVGFHNPLLLSAIVKAKLQAKFQNLPDLPAHKDINGIHFEIGKHLDQWMKDKDDFYHVIQQIYYGAYEPLLIQAMRDFLKQGDVVIDAGANIGYMTANAASIVGNRGQVHCFEPVPQYFQNIQRIVELNSNYTIICNQSALGDQPGTAKIFVHDMMFGGSSLIPDGHEDENHCIEIPVIRLDDYIEEKQLKQVALIKIDIEGYELMALRGLQRYLEKAVQLPVIICEVIPWKFAQLGHTMKDLADFVGRFGYTAHKTTNHEPVDIASIDIMTDLILLPSKH